ncbi:MAG: 50S ribosomal protein L21e [Candidatus Methanomethylicota archaeon]|jgi:large subunit ribosomal protein L21e|uniref:Large ribosomal subunit protein eL21 n=1 Tax=Thermoproteota archaeon TaxID=2056631 RepID=A0A520KGR0_9CREN|nr:MAG: 50S ribosomal protein L21e [Candidatus Verstraetearchaeota archaeon]TDA37718.1 MAG: 50S ribosomal protein L21e [Candidatus Verstraetearchaeota archaeon]
MKHSLGYRNRTRKLLRKGIREKWNPITRILREYKEGEKVVIKIDPSFVKGMPHRRFHGKTGIIMGKRGRAYVIKVLMGDYEKTIIARPEHIVPLEVEGK